MNLVLNVDKLSFSYEKREVLSNLSFQIKEGEFIGIIGPNGGGKSTLLKLILGLLPKSSGQIKLSPKVDRIGYVPQLNKLDRSFPISVIEVVLAGLLSELPWYGLFNSKQREKALTALEKVGMENFKNHAFGELSGGQAQRVLIARALVSNPQLLLLDEPTANVDTQTESEIYSLLKKMQGQMTILIVTHDLNVAIHQVDRVFCIQRTLVTLQPKEVCEHYAIGLYHNPLISN